MVNQPWWPNAYHAHKQHLAGIRFLQILRWWNSGSLYNFFRNSFVPPIHFTKKIFMAADIFTCCHIKIDAIAYSKVFCFKTPQRQWCPYGFLTWNLRSTRAYSCLNNVWIMSEYLLFKVIFNDVYSVLEIEKPHETAEKWLSHAVFWCFTLVDAAGLEPATSRVWGERSNQLSYASKKICAVNAQTESWWPGRESNSRYRRERAVS